MRMGADFPASPHCAKSGSNPWLRPAIHSQASTQRGRRMTLPCRGVPSVSARGGCFRESLCADLVGYPADVSHPVPYRRNPGSHRHRRRGTGRLVSDMRSGEHRLSWYPESRKVLKRHSCLWITGITGRTLTTGHPPQALTVAYGFQARAMHHGSGCMSTMAFCCPGAGKRALKVKACSLGPKLSSRHSRDSPSSTLGTLPAGIHHSA